MESHATKSAPVIPIRRSRACDFCAHPDSTTTYPCRDFSLTTAASVKSGEETLSSHGGVLHVDADQVDRSRFPVVVYRGDWAACALCRVLIEASRIEDLTQRIIEEIRRQSPSTRLTLDDIRLMLLLFWEHRLKAAA